MPKRALPYRWFASLLSDHARIPVELRWDRKARRYCVVWHEGPPEDVMANYINATAAELSEGCGDATVDMQALLWERKP